LGGREEGESFEWDSGDFDRGEKGGRWESIEAVFRVLRVARKGKPFKCGGEQKGDTGKVGGGCGTGLKDRFRVRNTEGPRVGRREKNGPT